MSKQEHPATPVTLQQSSMVTTWFAVCGHQAMAFVITYKHHLISLTQADHRQSPYLPNMSEETPQQPTMPSR